ncbi:hypothetical protein HDU93_001304 [Gonapodya sp. JEL0774]|nr:hypothetical protein HDU93_001304 [Gonapodya sp. JEL0774]
MAEDVEEYQYQLDTVTEALEKDPNNAELLKLKTDLQDLIALLGPKSRAGGAATTTSGTKRGLEDDEEDADSEEGGELETTRYRVGQTVSAKYSLDGKWYDAVVEDVSMDSSGRGVYKVKYSGYGNTEERSADDLRAAKRAASVDLEEVVAEGEKALAKDSKAKFKKKAKKERKEKPDEVADRAKGWQQFAHSTKKKKIEPINSKSIFRTTDDPGHKVGVVGSGKPVIKAAGGGISSNPLGIPMGPLGLGLGGTHVTGSQRISHLRQHRLRELAVQKLAKAYRIDEVATSVLTMQSASALDDVGLKVLKKNPNSADAMFVHFFHEKIPSRMLAASTTTDGLDRIVQQSPTVAEYYRTRAMVRGFREEFPQALKDWRMALQLVRKRKKAAQAECEKAAHTSVVGEGTGTKRSRGGGSTASAGGVVGDTATQPSTNTRYLPHPVNWDEDLDECSEAQLYFLRGACYHQFAVSLIDRAVRGVNERLVLGLAEAVKIRKKRKGKKKNGVAAEQDEMDGRSDVVGSSALRGRPNARGGHMPPGGNAAKEVHTMATLTPSTSYLPSDVAMAPPATYRPALEPLGAQVAHLIRRSIRDHAHFLTFFPNSLPPFLHPSMPAMREEARLASEENAAPSASPATTPTTPLADSVGRVHSAPTNTAQATTFPEFLHSIPAQSLSISDASPSLPASGPASTSPASALIPRSSTSSAASLAQAHAIQAQLPASGNKPTDLPNLGTYHPLLVEAWYAIGLNYLILGDWYTAMQWHERTTKMAEVVEGYPVFLPARSMSQADYVEILSRMKNIVGQNKRAAAARPNPRSALSSIPPRTKPLLAIAVKEHEDERTVASPQSDVCSRSVTPTSEFESGLETSTESILTVANETSEARKETQEVEDTQATTPASAPPAAERGGTPPYPAGVTPPDTFDSTSNGATERDGMSKATSENPISGSMNGVVERTGDTPPSTSTDESPAPASSPACAQSSLNGHVHDNKPQSLSNAHVNGYGNDHASASATKPNHTRTADSSVPKHKPTTPSPHPHSSSGTSGSTPSGASSSSSSSGASFRAYPLHTKRADNVLLWLQSYVVPLGEIIDKSHPNTSTKKKHEGAGEDEDADAQA